MRCGRTTPEFIFDHMLPAGYMTQARQLAEGLLLAATGFDFRLPELLSGSSRTQCVSPQPYPAACQPQAWAAAVPIARALRG